MLFRSAQTFMFMEGPGQAIFPGIAIALAVLGLNPTGRADCATILDPRLRVMTLKRS